MTRGYLLGAGDEGGPRRDVSAAPISRAAAAATCGLAVPPRGRPSTRHEPSATLPKVALHSTAQPLKPVPLLHFGS